MGSFTTCPDTRFQPDYDFVYWNIWDDIDFREKWQHAYADQAFEVVAPQGRLALGFYDRDEDRIERKTAWLQRRFGGADGRHDSDSGGEFLLWWQR